MKSKKTTTVVDKETITNKPASLFDKENLLWMLGGIAVMIIGFLLMAGGRSEDPNVFDPKEVYSTTRITIAPILILVGLVILVIAIFRHPKNR
jgi:uncharacterized membrane protein